MTAYTHARRRCCSPDGRPGAWHAGLRPTWDAMAEAIRTAQRDPHMPLTDEEIGPRWERLKARGWQIQTERSRDE